MSVPLLWQFRFSHFNEKVRWALDYKGITYKRNSLVPGLHMLPTLLRSGQRQVPLLILEGKVITDSKNIVAALETLKPTPSLYPADEALRKQALEWERFLGEEYGPHTRRVIFTTLLKNLGYMGDLLTYGLPAPAAIMYRLGLPCTAMFMRFDMKLNEAEAANSRKKIDEVLTRIEKEKGPEGFLVGDQFSIADLTAAALSSPLMHTPHYAYPLPEPIAPELAQLFAEYADRDAIKWAYELFEKFRPAKTGP